MTDKEMIKGLRGIIAGLISEYEKQKNLYDKAGLNAELKADALNGMANVVQLQGLAIQNLGNFNLSLGAKPTK